MKGEKLEKLREENLALQERISDLEHQLAGKEVEHSELEKKFEML